MSHAEHIRRIAAKTHPQPTSVRSKQPEREQLHQHLQQFLQRGGQITHIAPGISARREGSMSIVINTQVDATAPRTRPRAQRNRSAKNEQ